MSLRFLKQSDPLWGSLKLGASKVSISKAGCLLTTYAEACRVLGLDTSATPATVNKKALKANAYIGAGLVQHVLARALGFTLGDLITDDDAIRAELVKHREVDTIFVVHLDHGGTRAPDHFALGLLVDPACDLIVLADPATGAPCKLSLKSLSGPANWGNKQYAIRSIRTVTKSQASV